MEKRLPQSFLTWAYDGRKKLVQSIASGEKISREKIFLGFTRHSPAVITDGPAGLNGSIKGVGFIPKSGYINDILAQFIKHIDSGYDESYSQRGLDLLIKLIWNDEARERLDFTRLVTLELAKSHTWTNIQDNPRATLLFFEPPVISFELRCFVEIHTDDIIHEFVNAQHDVYHKPDIPAWGKRPAYLFKIEEIYDNSATQKGFGNRIY